MNRRHFLGLALGMAASPVFAKKKKTHSNEPRILTLHNLHTEEQLRITYRIGDHYQRDALHKLNHLLRDHRENKAIAMDPKLFDLLYELQIRSGHTDGKFEIYSAYRSPKTNAMLRKTSRLVAKHSYHMRGQAVDIHLPGCSNRRLRKIALSLRCGGVGYYPRRSFVHVDTGPVRSWRA